MMKLLGKLVVFLLFVLFAGVLYTFFQYKDARIHVRPYPYVFLPNAVSNEDIEKAQSADILIFGDAQLSQFKRFKERLSTEISGGLKKNIIIEIISSDHEGLHRSLEKLRRMNKLPPVIIYWGGNDEHFESRFNLTDYEKIESNLTRFHNPKISSVIMAFPFLSKVIYRPVNYVIFDKNIAEDSVIVNSHGIQTKLRLMFELQKLELAEFIDIVRIAEKNLIFITSPINLEIPPKIVCANTITEKGRDLEEYFLSAITSGKSKDIYNKLQEYVRATMANAKAYYLLGLAQKEMGKFQEARQSFIYASAYDCKMWRTNPLFNQQIRNVSKENGITLIDFDSMVSQQLGRDVLFLDQFSVQDVFYEMLVTQLAGQIKQILKL